MEDESSSFLNNRIDYNFIFFVAKPQNIIKEFAHSNLNSPVHFVVFKLLRFFYD